MIQYRNMTIDEVSKLREVDRSEHIDLVYSMKDGVLVEDTQNHECPNWDAAVLAEIEERYVHELNNGGLAVGGYDGDRLIAFGVLAHKFRGELQDQLQVDLMYVSRTYRRQGIGTRILNELVDEARRRGAKSLYISSTETRSAVSFYKSNGSRLTEQVDKELFQKEPHDIHMTMVL